jgi:hypothetical protein
MIALLQKLMEQNGKGYLFSRDGGAKPVTRRYLFDEFHLALQRIGVSREEITRHGLTISQVQTVMGHKTESMPRQYSHTAPFIRLKTELEEAVAIVDPVNRAELLHLVAGKYSLIFRTLCGNKMLEQFSDLITTRIDSMGRN